MRFAAVALLLVALVGYLAIRTSLSGTGTRGAQDEVERDAGAIPLEVRLGSSPSEPGGDTPTVSETTSPGEVSESSSDEGQVADRVPEFSVELPLGCYRSLEEMPEDLRQEALRILGEVPEGQYHLFHFGDRELHTSRIKPIPESPEIYAAVADCVAASSVVKVIRTEYVEEAELRGEVTRFDTIEEAREFSNRERNRIVSSSLNEGFIVVDLTELFARRDYIEAVEFEDACRSTVSRSQHRVLTYGYLR